LKILKNIEPDRNYADRSLSTIVMSPRNSKTSWFSFTFFRVAEYGAAVAMVGLLLFVMVGNSSLVSLFSPIRSNSLNSGGLRAEAEAIDIQIKLLGLDYEESSSTLQTATTPAVLRKKAPRPAVTPSATETSTASTATTTPTPEIAEVLELLSN
ncbi:MAG: hypothetical protein AAB903_00905, partial [Patescibacteria group bacterium]